MRRRGMRSKVPQADYRFEAGDVVVLLGRPENLAVAEQRLVARLTATRLLDSASRHCGGVVNPLQSTIPDWRPLQVPNQNVALRGTAERRQALLRTPLVASILLRRRSSFATYVRV